MKTEFGENITALDNSHVDQLVSLAKGTPEIRSALSIDSLPTFQGRDLFHANTDYSLVAVKDQRVLGFSVARPSRYPKEAELIVPAVVDGTVRNHGIGSRLLERILADLVIMGFNSATCLVRFDNEQGIRFLEQHGFNISDERITDTVCLYGSRKLAEAQAA